jgi:hypothetical protein
LCKVDIEDAASVIEIEQVLYRYCRGIDRGLKEVISSVYHPDAIDEHYSLYADLGKKFGDHIVPAMDRSGRVGQQIVTNVLVELDGDTARVESYFCSVHAIGDGDGGHALVFGRYLDRFERRDGPWLIAHRAVVVDTTRVVAPGAWELEKLFRHGGRRDHDPSSGFFTGPAVPA